jgi:hypothetical protein
MKLKKKQQTADKWWFPGLKFGYALTDLCHIEITITPVITVWNSKGKLNVGLH